MSRIDIVIVLVFLLGGFLGYRRGFLMELFFLFALVLGVFLGFKLTGAGVALLQKHFNADTTFLPYLSFLLIFLVVVLAVSIVGRAFKNSIDKTFLGRMDEVAGAVLGIAKYAFCLSVLFWLAASLHYTLPLGWSKGSFLFPAVSKLAPGLAHAAGSFVPFFKETFRQF